MWIFYGYFQGVREMLMLDLLRVFSIAIISQKSKFLKIFFKSFRKKYILFKNIFFMDFKDVFFVRIFFQGL